MNPVALMLVAYACISPVEPAGASHTVAYMCAPPHVEVAAAVPVRVVKRKMASKRADKCGSQRAVWRKLKNGRMKYRCV